MAINRSDARRSKQQQHYYYHISKEMYKDDKIDETFRRKPYGLSVNKCVCCGTVVPEGKQVCPNCERLASAKRIKEIKENIQLTRGEENGKEAES